MLRFCEKNEVDMKRRWADVDVPEQEKEETGILSLSSSHDKVAAA